MDADIGPFAQINADPDVMKYFPNVLTETETANRVLQFRSHIENHGFGFYAVDWKEPQQFIGFIGLNIPGFSSFFTPCVEIGWRLSKSFWNRGLATEGAKGVLHFAFNQLELKEIYSFTAVSNLPSERVMQKIGMGKFGYFNHPSVDPGSDLCRHVIYKSMSNDKL